MEDGRDVQAFVYTFIITFIYFKYAEVSFAPSSSMLTYLEARSSERTARGTAGMLSLLAAGWRETFPKASHLAHDILERLLAFNPNKRISVEEALKTSVPQAVP
jgi:serine/threonine protein kinase